MDDDFEFSWDFGETSKLKEAVKEVAKICPILFPDGKDTWDQRYRKTHLFKESSKRRQDIAIKALKEI